MMRREEYYTVYRAILARDVEDRVKFFIFFWQFFSTCEKNTQFLEFCKYQGGKI